MGAMRPSRGFLVVAVLCLLAVDSALSQGQRTKSKRATTPESTDRAEVEVADTENTGAESASATTEVAEFTIEHSFSEPTGKTEAEDDKTFTPRGILTLKVNADGKYKGGSIGKTELDEKTIAGLQALAERGLFYRIRVRSTANNDPAKGQYITASIPVCELQASGFREYWYVHVQDRRIVTISFQTSGSGCFKSKTKLFETKQTLTSKVMVVAPTTGRGPTVEPEVERAVKQEEKQKAEESGEGGSFLSKYWYIFAIGLVWMVMSPGDAPAAGGPAPAGARAGPAAPAPRRR